MAELTIYDSRGHRLDDDGRGEGDQRIKDLFFDGVRFAIDLLQREAICFFRARDDQSSRSEQYYAVYNYANRQELKELPTRVEQVVEDEEGMILDTSQDDTDIFDLLRSTRDPDLQYVDMDLRYDIEELLSNGRPIRLGVSSSDEAYGVIFNWLQADAERFAIAENATSSNLSSYDIVVDPSGHSSMTALGATEQALESLRERRRQRQNTGGTGEEYTPRRKAGLVMSVGLVVVGILLFGLIGGCTFVPDTANTVTASSCSLVGVGGSSGPAVNIMGVGTVGNDSLWVNGTVSGVNVTENQSATFEVQLRNGNAVNETQEIATESEFNTTVDFNQSIENPEELTVTIGEAEGNYTSFDRSDGTTPTETATAGANATENGTDTTQSDGNATVTDSNSGSGWWPFALQNA